MGQDQLSTALTGFAPKVLLSVLPPGATHEGFPYLKALRRPYQQGWILHLVSFLLVMYHLPGLVQGI